MMSKTKIIIPRGASYKLTVALNYTTGKRFTNPAAEVTVYVKRKLTQDYYDIELTGSYTNGADGSVWVFTFLPGTTDCLTPGRYFFEIRVDGISDGGGSYSYVAVSVDDIEFYIGRSVKSPTEGTLPIIS